MIEVRALASFEHSVPRRPGDRFHVHPRHATQLAGKGLVEILPVQQPDPLQAAGTPSSASPAAPASPQTTASESDSGETSLAETVPEAEQLEAPPITEKPAAPAADKAPKPGNRRGGRAAAAQ